MIKSTKYITPDCNNYKFLKNMFYLQSDTWYWNCARRHLFHNNRIYQVVNANVTQSRINFKFDYEMQQYQVAIIISEGIDNDDNRFGIYFVTLEEFAHYKHCAFVRIYDNADIGIVGEFNSIVGCIDKVTLKPDLDFQPGRVIMAGLLAFCREYKDSLGIVGLELSDLSRFHCKDPATLRPILDANRDVIELPISRYLTGQLPYYMQFGFKPENPKDEITIRNNLSKIMQIKTRDYPLIKIFAKSDHDIPQNIIDIINNRQNDRLTKTMSDIFNVDCLYYKTIYKKMYNVLNLDDIIDSVDDITYNIIL